MTCPKCNHYWCWTCGLPVSHWVHTFSENPFGCKFTPINGTAMIWKTLVFISGLIFIPLILTILPILAGVCYGLYGGCASCGYLCLHLSVDSFCTFILKLFMIIFSIPVFFIALGLASGLGVIASGLGAIASVPALLIHCYMFGRSIYWWNKNRNHSFAQKAVS